MYRNFCMNRNICRVAAFLLSLLCVPFAIAHHSAVVSYDLNREVVHRDVTVLEWRFTNPHPQLVFEAPDADGNIVKWSAGTENIQELTRNGYTKDTFKPGQVLSLKGKPTRDGRPALWIREVILEGGTAFKLDEPAPAAVLASSESERNNSEGHNQFTGVWEFIYGPLSAEDRSRAPKDAVFIEAYGQTKELPVGESGKYPLTAKGHEFQANWTKKDDECRPFSPWHSMTAPFMVEIDELRAGRIHIRYEFMDLERTVWLDGRDHPPLRLVPRTLQGHSVGHWEGDTLVVETVNMLPNVITRNGIYHSDKAVFKERISREGDMLTVVQVLEDPEFLAEPIAVVVKRRFVPDGELLAYGPCRPQLSEVSGTDPAGAALTRVNRLEFSPMQRAR